MKRRAPSFRRSAARRERGIVVFVALIAVVLLSLAAVGLMRSVHTNTLVVGNLAFRQAAQALSSAAIEKAIFDMFPPTQTIADYGNHDLARNYYATLQPGQNAIGVPAALQGDLSGYPTAAQVISDSADSTVAMTARYVIERMCDNDALGKTQKNANLAPDCEMIPPKQSPAREANTGPGIPVPGIPFYRVTVRVDGPGNAVAFTQAMLR